MYRLVHCFGTLPQKSALSGQLSARVDFETRIIVTNWPACRRGYGRRHRQSCHRPPSTFDLGWPVTALPVASDVASSACQSVCRSSHLGINSRALSAWQCTLLRECRETVHYHVLSQRYNQIIRNGKYFRFFWYKWWRVGLCSHSSSEIV